jgi:hypothetical protein
MTPRTSLIVQDCPGARRRATALAIVQEIGGRAGTRPRGDIIIPDCAIDVVGISKVALQSMHFSNILRVVGRQAPIRIHAFD